MTPAALPAVTTTTHKTFPAKLSKFNHPLDPLTPHEVCLPIGRRRPRANTSFARSI